MTNPPRYTFPVQAARSFLVRLPAPLIFVVGLLAYEYFAFDFDADRTEILSLVAADNITVLRSFILTGISVCLTAVIILLAVGSSATSKAVYFVVFAAALSIEYAHHAAFDRFSTFSTANLGLYAGDWAFSAKALAMYFNPWCFPPLIVFLILLCSRRQEGVSRRAVALTLLFAVLFAAFTAYFTSNRYMTVSPWAFARTTIGLPIISTLGRKGSKAFGMAPRRRAEINYSASRKPFNNIILIVDESVRGDHLGLNGYRNTPVPVLSELSKGGHLKNYGVIAAGSTCSVASNNLLLTGLNALPDRDLEVYAMPTIFQYARAMGYETYDFDGQVAVSWKGTLEDLRFIDHRQNPEHLVKSIEQPHEIDGEIARRVRRIVDSSSGNFIWINKRGVHKPYSDSVPESGRKRSVMDQLDITYSPYKPTAELISEYDQAISYNLNLFFRSLFPNGRVPDDTFVIYTSDHGQSLREAGANVSHCAGSRAEARVPLFLVGERLGTNRILNTTYRAHHGNIFPTLLDLMSVPRSIRSHQYAPSLYGATASKSVRRTYIGPDLTGEDGGKLYYFDP